FQLDANRKTALELRNEIAGFRDVKSSGSDEQDVIRAYETVAGVNGGSLDDGQNIALHAFAADVWAVAAFASGDLVDFIEEDNAVRFDAVEGNARHLVHVDELLLFFLHQIIHRVGHAHIPLLRSA